MSRRDIDGHAIPPAPDVDWAWAILDNDTGRALIGTISATRAGAISAWLGFWTDPKRATWGAWYRRGYRTARVRLVPWGVRNG